MSKITGDTFFHGRKSGIGQTAVQLTTRKLRAKRGILVKASIGNSGIVYVGSSPSITADSVDATDGYELSAGESKTVEVTNPSTVFVIASAPGQKVFWFGD